MNLKCKWAEASFPFKLERKFKWGRESFISFFTITEFWHQWQPEYITAVLEMARGTSLQLTTHLQLPASWVKSRNQTNPINVDKSAHVLKKKKSFPIETGRAAGAPDLHSCGKVLYLTSSNWGGRSVGKSRRGFEIWGDGL